MKFGDNLRKLRKNKQISQEQLAEKVNVSRQSVSKWENGEAYPEMNNILELCKIFKCNINDLVNDSIVDLDSLDEEIKMSVVKLKKDKQEKVKLLSKILFMIGRIGAILAKVGIGFLVVFMILIPIVMSNVNIKDDKIIADGKVVMVSELKDGFRVAIGSEHVVVGDINNKDIQNFKRAYNKYGKVTLISLFELGFIIMIVFLIFVIIVLNHLDKLFTNIYDGDTPFTLENVEHIKKMSNYMIAAIIASAVGSVVFNISTAMEDVMEFDLFNVVEIIFLFALSYIFEYGYEIQLDSKGKIYGDEE